LAYAQTYFHGHETAEYLNRLVIRAHNAIYGKAKSGYVRKAIRFFTTGFPLLLYERRYFFLAAFLILFAGFILAFVLTSIDPNYAAHFLPKEMISKVKPHAVDNQPQWNHAIVSSQIMVNNITVSFSCFAFGVLFGVGTVWSLFMNGMLLGALAALYHRVGAGIEFWAYIWPHGVIELTAIFISGAAGLALAYRFFVPGELTRRHAWIKEGKVTIQLMLGVIPMLIVAGIVEGYITPAPWPHWTKYMISALNLLFLLAYFGWPYLQKRMNGKVAQ
jgi:uncharacterized membrane protein SpoIIM required for sporulation